MTPDSTQRPDTPARVSGFGRTSVGGRLLTVALPLAALAAVWWVTHRSPPAPAGAPPAHDHTAAPSRDANSLGRPVNLTGEQARRIGVTYAPVARRVLPWEVRTVGQVTVDETRVTSVALRFEAWVEALYADFTGRAVRQGDPLLRVYAPLVVNAEEELLLARRLVGEVATAAPDTRTGASDLVAAARQRLVQWDVPEEEIARLERTGRVERSFIVSARSAGIIVEKNVVAGQRVMAGEPLFRLADLGTVWVDGEVYEQDLRAIRIGQAAVAELDAWPGERWNGRIAWVAPTLSPETRTARVRVVFPNPALRLKPGMAATLLLTGTGSGSQPVLTVPRSAVLVTGERALVFVKRADGQLEPRTVTIGHTGHELVEVLRGVSLGDTVVASATFLVDAESNLGTALGGMGDMPGMEITRPPTSTLPPAPAPTRKDTARPRKER